MNKYDKSLEGAATTHTPTEQPKEAPPTPRAEPAAATPPSQEPLSTPPPSSLPPSPRVPDKPLTTTKIASIPVTPLATSSSDPVGPARSRTESRVRSCLTLFFYLLD